MSDEMRKQLGAYLDGELLGSSLQAMQSHLETCLTCREELEALRRLSETLRSTPLPACLLPGDHFANQLVGRLPPRSADRASFPVSRPGWLVPLGLLTGLILLQATGVLSLLMTLVSGNSQLGDPGAWFVVGSGQPLWFSAVQTILQNVLDLKAPGGLQAANEVVVSLQQWLIQPLFWQLIITTAYLGGLAAWWTGRQSSAPQEQALD
jgi:anti-sigma factor RsiW